MKTILVILLAVISIPAFAYDPANNVLIQPTLPGTHITNYTAQGYAITPDGRIYQTIPGINTMDYMAPQYIIQGNHVQPVLPGTNIPDFLSPGYTIH